MAGYFFNMNFKVLPHRNRIPNIIDKIWEHHVVDRKDGHPDILAIDFHLLHEVTTPQAFTLLREKGLNVYDTNRCIATIDHNVSTDLNRHCGGTQDSIHQMETLRQNCEDFGVRLLDLESGHQGIVHVVGPELGITQPGATMVCGDSHTSTHGAVGALAFGIGTTHVAHVLGSGCMLQSKPKTMKIHFKGKKGKGITSKDLILRLIQEIGIGGGTGYVFEYTGEVIRSLSMEERFTICNMSIEGGARAGLISPDKVTFNYLKNRPCAPRGKDWDRAVEYWSSLASPIDAHYDKVVEIDINGLAPMVTWGTNPGEGISVDQVIPNPKDYAPEKADKITSSLDYTHLEGGKPITGTPVDYVFIGSCTNARISDLRAAAKIMEGRHVHKNVEMYIVPGSEEVRAQAIEEGLDEIFAEAGVNLRNPGCSMCLAMNEDKVPEGKRCVSTSNRNFIGRQGKGSITHLVSPIMAAAAAVEGEIVDVREFL